MIPEAWHNHTRTAARTHHYGTIAPMDEPSADRIERIIEWAGGQHVRLPLGIALLAAVLIVPVVVHQVIVSTSHEEVRHGSR